MHRTLPRPSAPLDRLADYALLATCRIEIVQLPRPQAVPNGREETSAAGASRPVRRRRAPYMYTGRLGGWR